MLDGLADAVSRRRAPGGKAGRVLEDVGE
jgi:hypothetical protein